MVARSRLVVLALVFMVALGSMPVHAQQPAQTQTAEGIPASLQKLALAFNVEMDMLTSLLEQGYTIGQIWLALEIMHATDTSLEEAIPLTADAQGHGWGVLASILGIDPGSEEFHALKFDWHGLGSQEALHQALQQQLRTRKQEHTLAQVHQNQHEAVEERKEQKSQNRAHAGQNDGADQEGGTGNQATQQAGAGTHGAHGH